MVLAEMELIRVALNFAPFDRLVLMSDDSFPLRSVSAMKASLRTDQLWIGQHTPDWARQRYDSFCFFDSEATNPKNHHLLERNFGGDDFAAIRRMEALQRSGKKVVPTIYFGSQWWCLTADAAQHVLAVHERDVHQRQSFQFSVIPDEHYIQTIIGVEQGLWRIRPTLMHFDLFRKPKPFVFDNIADMEAALASKRLLVRKVAHDDRFLRDVEDQFVRIAA